MTSFKPVFGGVALAFAVVSGCTCGDRALFQIAISPSGAGTIRSQPSGIACDDARCIGKFDTGAKLTITAMANSSFAFAGWSGDCQGNDPSLSVRLNKDKSCAAEFSKSQFLLAVGVSSNLGDSTGGRVHSTPAGIDCGVDSSQTCSSNFDSGSLVILNAFPADETFQFRSWSGCSGEEAPMIAVLMDSAKQCQAQFAKMRVAITVEVSSDRGGPGTGGSVTSNPSRISCPPSKSEGCSADFDRGTPVQLTATPADSSFVFSSWSGCRAVTTNPLIIAPDAPLTCRANFRKVVHQVSADLNPDGYGVVISQPSGIDCGASGSPSCTSTFDAGSYITLTAVPDEAQANPREFLNWAGSPPCNGIGNRSVSFTVTGPASCMANFWSHWARSYEWPPDDRTITPSPIAALANSNHTFTLITSVLMNPPDEGRSGKTLVSSLDRFGRNRFTRDIRAGDQLIGAAIARTNDDTFALVANDFYPAVGHTEQALIQFDANANPTNPQEIISVAEGYSNSQAGCITTLSTGGYAIGGNATVAGQARQVGRVVRLRADGAIQWDSKFCYQRFTPCLPAVCSAANTSVVGLAPAPGDGLLAVGTHTGYDDCSGNPPCMYVTRLENDGALRWQLLARRTIGRFTPQAVAPALDGGYIIAGSGNVVDAIRIDAALIWLDDSGTITRAQAYRNTDGVGPDSATRVVALDSNSYLVVGNTRISGKPPNNKLWAFAINASGGPPLWAARYGGPQDDFGISADLTPTQSLLLLGRTLSFLAASNNPWLLNLDQTGQISFNRNPAATRTVTTTSQLTPSAFNLTYSPCSMANSTLGAVRSLPLTTRTVEPTIHTQAD